MIYSAGSVIDHAMSNQLMQPPRVSSVASASRAVRNDDLSCYTLYYLYRYLAAVSAVMIKVSSMWLLLVMMSRFKLTKLES